MKIIFPLLIECHDPDFVTSIPATIIQLHYKLEKSKTTLSEFSNTVEYST
jgi:hypothetical protein